MTLGDESTYRSRWIHQLVGLVLGGACLVWVVKDLTWSELAAQLGAVHWPWLLPAVCFEVGSYGFDAIRWQFLLARRSFTTLTALQAALIGLLVNQVLPMRMGELARALVAARRIGIPTLDVIPSLLVARLLDGVCVAIAIGAIALLQPLPASIVTGVRLFGGMVAVLSFLFILLIRRSPEAVARWAKAGKGRLSRSIRSFSARIAVGLSVAGNTPRFWPAVLVSGSFLACQAVSFWLVIHAYGLSLPFLAGTTVFLLVHLGSAVPAGPANIGSFQFMVALGLRLFGVNKTTAAGFSIVVFVVLTLPLFVAGAIALAASDLSIITVWQRLSESERSAPA